MIDRHNNFNILRLIFASTVIVSHSYPLTNNEEIFQKISNNQIDLGGLSVNIFFIISGFLVFKSIWYSKSVFNYIWKRVLRLFPALLVVLIVTLIVVLFVNTSANILKQRDFYTYLPRNLSLYRIQHNIKNVFEYNPYPRGINGSLWTLSYEFTMYMFILPFIWLKKFRKEVSLILLLFIFCIACYCDFFRPRFLQNIIGIISINSTLFYRLLVFFISGAILTFVNFKAIKSKIAILLLTLSLIFAVWFDFYKYASPFLLPILVIMTGLSYNKFFWKLTEKTGDLSYGIYIYGFLVQQTLMNFFDMNPIELMSSALFLTPVFAYFSWHIVEKKALKYKNYI